MEQLVVLPTRQSALHSSKAEISFSRSKKKKTPNKLTKHIKNRKLHFICNTVLICHKNINIKHTARYAAWASSHHPHSFNVQKQWQSPERKGQLETLLHCSQGTLSQWERHSSAHKMYAFIPYIFSSLYWEFTFIWEHRLTLLPRNWGVTLKERNFSVISWFQQILDYWYYKAILTFT